MFYEVYDGCLSKYGLKRKESEDTAKKHTYEHRPFLENITAGKLALIEQVDQSLDMRAGNGLSLLHNNAKSFL